MKFRGPPPPVMYTASTPLEVAPIAWGLRCLTDWLQILGNVLSRNLSVLVGCYTNSSNCLATLMGYLAKIPKTRLNKVEWQEMTPGVYPRGYSKYTWQGNPTYVFGLKISTLGIFFGGGGGVKRSVTYIFRCKSLFDCKNQYWGISVLYFLSRKFWCQVFFWDLKFQTHLFLGQAKAWIVTFLPRLENVCKYILTMSSHQFWSLYVLYCIFNTLYWK